MNNLLTVNIETGGYFGRSDLLKDIRFSVKAGELVGLIGANGAGKSSTIKGILGILEHCQGSIEAVEFAYIPERPIFYENMTLWEHLEFLYGTLNTDREDFLKRADELLQLFQLKEDIHKYPQSYSKGMQQKGMIILAFLKQADLYLIDEPFMGLDPRATIRLLNLIEQEKQRGAGILMSTHVLDTAEKICDRFVLIHSGRLLVDGTLSKIQQASKQPETSLLNCFDILTGDIGHEN